MSSLKVLTENWLRFELLITEGAHEELLVSMRLHVHLEEIP